MLIDTIFTRDNIGVSGLHPTIFIMDVDTQAVVINNVAMTEKSLGLYVYDFATFDSTKNYFIKCDAHDVSLDGEGIQYSDNKWYTDTLAQLIANKVLQSLNIENFTLSLEGYSSIVGLPGDFELTYRLNGVPFDVASLESVKIYPTFIDAQNDTNALQTITSFGHGAVGVYTFVSSAISPQGHYYFRAFIIPKLGYMVRSYIMEFYNRAMSNMLVYYFNNEAELALPDGMIVFEDHLALEQSGGYYDTSNPYLTIPIVIRASFILYMDLSTNSQGEVRLLIENNGLKYFYNVTSGAWEVSDGTFDQSNSFAVLQDNINTFLDGGLKNFKIGVFLHSDGLTNPEVFYLEVAYNREESSPVAKTRVYGKVENFQDNVDNYVLLDRDKTLIGNNIYLRDKIMITPDASGNFEVFIYNTEIMSEGTGYIFAFGDAKYFRKVPNVPEVAFEALPEKYV
jgi:hypothetical protein